MTDAQKWPIRHQHIKNPDGETVIVPWSGGSWVLARDVAPLLELYEAFKEHEGSPIFNMQDYGMVRIAMAECRKREDERR